MYSNLESSTSKIFVGNLPLTFTHENLSEYFEKYGKLKDCVVIMDKETGKSKGYGFITYEDERDADDVVSETHIIEGRQIACKKAMLSTSPSQFVKPKEAIEKTNRIKIMNLSWTITDDEFKEYFEQFGKVEDFERINDPITGEFKGSAEVIFEDDETVELIMKQLDELKIGDKKVLT